MEIDSDRDTRIRARCQKSARGQIVRAAPEWIETNDYIYWRNGICDRTFCDSGLANARMRTIDVPNVSIDNDAPWAEFIDPIPRHVIVLDDAIEFVCRPGAEPGRAAQRVLTSLD